MIWNTSLSDGEVTTLNRDIYLDCAAYSGNGQAAASVQQTFTLPVDQAGHSWLISGHGMRTGDVFGTFEIVVESIDVNGTVLATDTSSAKAFETSWASTTMRFDPPQHTVDLRITIPLNLVATSTDGSVYLDSVDMYPIRPNLGWVNGSIAETAVSTGARSFEPGTTYIFDLSDSSNATHPMRLSLADGTNQQAMVTVKADDAGKTQRFIDVVNALASVKIKNVTMTGFRDEEE